MMHTSDTENELDDVATDVDKHRYVNVSGKVVNTDGHVDGGFVLNRSNPIRGRQDISVSSRNAAARVEGRPIYLHGYIFFGCLLMVFLMPLVTPNNILSTYPALNDFVVKLASLLPGIVDMSHWSPLKEVFMFSYAMSALLGLTAGVLIQVPLLMASRREYKTSLPLFKNSAMWPFEYGRFDRKLVEKRIGVLLAATIGCWAFLYWSQFVIDHDGTGKIIEMTKYRVGILAHAGGIFSVIFLAVMPTLFWGMYVIPLYIKNR